MRPIIAAKSSSRIICGARSIINGCSRRRIRNRNSFSAQTFENVQCSLPLYLNKTSIGTKTSFSSMAASVYDDNFNEQHHHSTSTIDEDNKAKHCETCACDNHKEPELHVAATIQQEESLHVCHDDYLNNNLPLPPPLPEPKYSFHRRIMPSSLIQFSSPDGRQMFQESLASGKGNAFFPLTEQFLNQSEPAYCGVTTLIMVLNAIGIDPNVRWKGGWRWYGSEEMILDLCCVNPERVKRAGILMEEFYSLARCQGLRVEMKRPYLPGNNNHPGEEVMTGEYYSLDDFRKDIIESAQNPPVYSSEDVAETEGGFMVVSFSRSALGQTGDGHFSPVAAYSEETDRCLILDVARFKYPPYWVSVKDLYESMRPEDAVTNKSRGWFLMHPPKIRSNDCGGPKFTGTKTMNEAKRPAEIVPLAGETKEQVCPVGDIKVKYCSINGEVHQLEK